MPSKPSQSEESKARRSAAKRLWRDKNPNYGKEHYRANKPEYIARAAARYEEKGPSVGTVYHADRARRKAEKYAGRPRPEFCECCGKERKVVFDHSHKTGEFRGWICQSCNLALGHIHDDIEWAMALALYLERHRRGESGESIG